MIESVDIQTVGILSVIGAVIGLFMQLLALNSKIRARAAKEQSLVDSVELLKKHATESQMNQRLVSDHLSRIEKMIHTLELNNERQHGEVSERVRALEVILDGLKTKA